MIAVLTAIHVLVSVSLILVVLLQSGKGGGLAGVLGGGGGGQTLFGGRGAADFLSKTTSFLAVLFMITSIALTLASARRSGPRSVVREALGQAEFVPPGTATPEELNLLQPEAGAAGEAPAPGGATPAPATGGQPAGQGG